MTKKDKFFPIKTNTACQLKWAWSTLFLNSGVTRSCHRTSKSRLTEENFYDFHNTPTKIKDREDMLAGKWPEKNCGYCKKIEDIGGTSDRMRSLQIPNLSPKELEEDPTLTKIEPTIVEVYLNNTCNMSCLYCHPRFSSAIASENKKFGDFKKNGVELINYENHFKNLVPYFWKWFEYGFQKIKRLHVLGGEPFYQKEFEKMLDMIKLYPNPDCEINIVTNLMVSEEKLNYFIDRFYELLNSRAIKRVDISCSIDCWGPQQEYTRRGIKLDHWEKNFNTILSKKWLVVNINQTISVLTIKTMPELLEKLKKWREQRAVGHFFGGIHPGPNYFKAEIFGNNFFAEDGKKILELMPTEIQQDKAAYEYMKGIFDHANSTKIDENEIENLIIYLDEKDRRHNTDWKTVFPWLVKFRRVIP